MSLFAGNVQSFPARRQDLDAGAAAQERIGELGAGGEEVLAVVQQEQQLPGLESLYEGVRQPRNLVRGERHQQYVAFRRVDQIIQNLIDAPCGDLASWRGSRPKQFDAPLLFPA